MSILAGLQESTPSYSFEFFPPKTEEMLDALYDAISMLKPVNPLYVSVTYGAGGSTRDKTVEIASTIHNEIGLETMAHLTCVGHSREDVTAVLNDLAQNGVRNVLALRGDPPKGTVGFEPHPEGFRSSTELIAHIRSLGDFHIAAACYPEGHVENGSLQQDLEACRSKIDAGADFFITQLFFLPETFLRYRDQAVAAGIDRPIVPGIMPVTNVDQLERFTKMCGASIPKELRDRLEDIRDDRSAVIEAGIEWAVEQCELLLREGAPGVHFYTLNRSHSSRIVWERLRVALPTS